MSVDTDRIERAVTELLAALGEDPDRDGLVKTPSRVARMYEELFAGFGEDPADHLEVTFAAEHDEMVMVRDIPFASLVRAPPGAVHRPGPCGLHPRATTGGSPGCPSWPGWSTATPSGSRSKSG